jgi:alpha-L-fucosidase
MPMQPWFPAAKLGIFVHWGIYAVGGVSESWALHSGELSREDYLAQLPRFTASRYDPHEWAALFARAGARYAVLTARHHDGVALWDNGLSVGQDLLTGFTGAMRAHGLKTGLYYSHSDWLHPDYASVRHSDPAKADPSPLVCPAIGMEDPVAWARYLSYRDRQVAELVRLQQPDLLWFDGAWERDESQWGLGELAGDILRLRPDTVLNGRMLSHGDYATPEQGLPSTRPAGPWELCLTLNDSWSYRPDDQNHKPVGLLVRFLAETIGLGGNLLLGIGPREDGSIPEPQAERLTSLGEWISANAEAIYPATAGLPPGYFHGPSTLSADRRTLYLFCFDPPRDGVAIRGLRSKVSGVRTLAGEELGHRVVGGHGEIPGLTWIDPPTRPAEYATVLAVTLDGELDLAT